MVQVIWRQDAKVRTTCRQRALGPQWSTTEQPQPRWWRSAAMVERRTWVNIAVHLCLHSFLIHNKHHLFENKVLEIYIFIKKCIRLLLKSSLSVDYVPVYICICVVYYTALLHHEETSHFSSSISLIHL